VGRKKKEKKKKKKFFLLLIANKREYIRKKLKSGKEKEIRRG
jgi:hypothetical protein